MAASSAQTTCLNGSPYQIWRLSLLGLVFHLVFILSVFDCYFTSPVVHGMKSFSLRKAETKRLVLIVGDGLRADLLFNLDPFPSIPGSPKVVAPFLRDVMEHRGAFGISHTHVPTESRPGHVAIIAGMYEDVSAVTKGWKTNPIDFDSVFNQSSHTFSFGSPDILPMFARGATPDKVKTWSYHEDDEDFTKDATALDNWVFEQLQTLFKNATTDALISAQLHSDKVVFFLHLLGLDTTGHSYRPHSKEYMNNIQVVDDIVHRTENLFAEFYQDHDTSFIFTADHGMSVIGNHGDGHPDNTRTPLIAWGKGIRSPLPDSHPSSHDAYSEPWGLKHLLRCDVEQADIAPMMAALLGINWPVNSVGVLPDVDMTRPGYLSPRDGEQTIAQAALINAQVRIPSLVPSISTERGEKVLVEHYRVKHEIKKSQTLLYRPYVELEGHASDISPLHLRMANIDRAMRNGQWTDARQQSLALIQLTLEGLRYLQTYDRLFLRAVVTLAYLGWSAYTCLHIFRPLNMQPKIGTSALASWVVTSITVTIVLAFWGVFAIERAPWTFYIYIAFPCYFWQQVLVQALPRLNHLQATSFRVIVVTAAVFALLQCMVAAYTHRSIWALCLVFMGLCWPIFGWPTRIRTQHRYLSLMWSLSCILTAAFPLLPVDKTESLPAILTGGVSLLAVGIYSIYQVRSKAILQHIQTIFVLQISLIVASMAITASSVLSLQAKDGLPRFNQVAGWTILLLASSLPFVSHTKSSDMESKMTMYFLGFGPCFIILSISVECLFYAAYALNLAVWIEVEVALRGNTKELARSGSSNHHRHRIYRFQPDDLRIACFFLFYVQVAFFGTGNVASISYAYLYTWTAFIDLSPLFVRSFYLEPVYRLVPIFSPFLMATLLIFKIVAPYVILSVTFASLNRRLQLPPFSLLLVALSLTDGMTITFFYNVTDTGSWLEIGQSISFFCITSLLLLWSAGICLAGEFLLDDRERRKLD